MPIRLVIALLLAASLVAAGGVIVGITGTEGTAGGADVGTVAPDPVDSTGGPATATSSSRSSAAGAEVRKIAAVGDIACAPDDSDFNDGEGRAGNCRHAAVAQMLGERPVEAVLLLGDTQYEIGASREYETAFDRSWGELMPLLRPVPGNHEYETPAAKGYFDYFNGVGAVSGRAGRRGAGYYSLNVGRWHVVALNSECGAIGGCGPRSRQYRWLRSDLAADRHRCTLAFSHLPRWSSGRHGNEPSMRSLWRLLAADRAELLLSGHEHDYERFAPKRADGRVLRRGLRQLVVGTGGKSLRSFPPSSEPGSRRRISTAPGAAVLALRPRRARVWFVGIVPQAGILDSARIRCRQ